VPADLGDWILARDQDESHGGRIWHHSLRRLVQEMDTLGPIVELLGQ
jgi:hypothetical protein